jgi:hypothetical protein
MQELLNSDFDGWFWAILTEWKCNENGPEGEPNAKKAKWPNPPADATDNDSSL